MSANIQEWDYFAASTPSRSRPISAPTRPGGARPAVGRRRSGNSYVHIKDPFGLTDDGMGDAAARMDGSELLNNAEKDGVGGTGTLLAAVSQTNLSPVQGAGQGPPSRCQRRKRPRRRKISEINAALFHLAGFGSTCHSIDAGLIGAVRNWPLAAYKMACEYCRPALWRALFWDFVRWLLRPTAARENVSGMPDIKVSRASSSGWTSTWMSPLQHTRPSTCPRSTTPICRPGHHPGHPGGLCHNRRVMVRASRHRQVDSYRAGRGPPQLALACDVNLAATFRASI